MKKTARGDAGGEGRGVRSRVIECIGCYKER